MGMALGALAGELLPERTPREAAGVLTVRHAGITLVLLLLAPVTSAQLDRSVDRTRERGVALLLDAQLPPLDKLALAGRSSPSSIPSIHATGSGGRSPPAPGASTTTPSSAGSTPRCACAPTRRSSAASTAPSARRSSSAAPSP